MSPRLRAHYSVTDPAAEKGRFDEFIALEHTEGIQQGQKNETDGEKYHEPSLFLIIEIKHEQAFFLCRESGFLSSPLPNNAQYDKRRPNEDEQGQDEQDDEVRIGPRTLCQEIDDKEKDDHTEVEYGNDRTGQGKRVIKH